MKRFLKTSLSALVALGASMTPVQALESVDIGLSQMPSSGYVLQRGVLQVDTYVNYATESMGEALGFDVSGANGVGVYEELGARLWFGLTDLVTANFVFGRSEFEYGQNSVETGFQEFKLKRGLFVNHDFFGFSSVEASWFRHSAYDFSANGAPSQNRSNTLYDYGYGLKFSNTKPVSDTWDFHSHLGYKKALVDGDGGQHTWETGLGVSKFWASKYRFDAYLIFREIDRDAPQRSTSSDSNRSLHLALTRHINERWSWDLRAQYNDNLFRGIWPFLDREMSRVSVSDYGFISLGLSYRTRYGLSAL